MHVLYTGAFAEQTYFLPMNDQSYHHHPKIIKNMMCKAENYSFYILIIVYSYL